MKIGILGSGTVGQQLGIGFIRLGYDVKMGTRDKSKLDEWIKNNNGSIGSFEEAAKFGEVIVLATAGSGTENAINLAKKENFENKIVVDVTNPLDHSTMPPGLTSSFGNSEGERIQRLLPKSKVVKAFNTISAYIMCNPKREEGDPDLFICGNDEGKEFVTKIAKEWGWKNVYDLGDLSNAYWLETFAMLWIVYGFKNNHWTHAFKLLKK
ncbi:MAG TPA: NAD(P)-binding domain-containing protein [Candidatus Nanoarchaeia archaeon]|nr:NAD(P)-binding domain-containing protein [Candidatus Nanoarchaeia archaeon]